MRYDRCTEGGIFDSRRTGWRIHVECHRFQVNTIAVSYIGSPSEQSQPTAECACRT